MIPLVSGESGVDCRFRLLSQNDFVVSFNCRFGNYGRFIVSPLHITIVNKMEGYASTFEVKQ